MNLASQPVVTSIPSSRNAALFGLDAHARVSTRQTALEPSTAGADNAMSWTGWVRVSNLGTISRRLFGVQMTASGNQQYVCQVLSQDFQSTTRNQRLNFSIFTDGSNFITVESTNKFLRNRTYFVAITYTGSEAASGFKMYLNGVEDTSANKFLTGTYTGARNDANNRFIVSRVDSGATRFRGNMRDLAVWNRVLTDAEVLELYNNGVPFDISTTSFYAGAIVSWWDMVADMESANNVNYNFSTVTNITHTSYPFHPSFEHLSFFNAEPLNTRYNAFGGLFRNNPGFDLITRSGTTHLANGKIVQYKFDSRTMAVTSPVDILTDGTYDLRNVSAGIVDGSIGVWLGRYTHTTGPFIDMLRFLSTDGLVGQAYGAGASIPTTLERFAMYGKLIKGNAQGEYFVPEYEINTGLTAYQINVLKRSAGGTWSKIPVWSGDNTEGYTESAICKVAANTYFILSRSDVLNGLYLFISTDGGDTWSAPFATGLGGGTCMADMAIAPNGTLTVVYADRSINRLVISHSNPIADIIADKTDWKNSTQVFESYSTDSTGILGYPGIVYYGDHLCISLSAEFSSSRADVYFGYGLLS